MPRPANDPIGEVLCPARDCERTVPVFRFRPRPDEKQRRWAGKLYCRCPDHGQLAPQEYLLEKATLWGPNNPRPSEPSNPQPQARLARQARQEPAPPPPPPPRRKGWGWFAA